MNLQTPKIPRRNPLPLALTVLAACVSTLLAAAPATSPAAAPPAPKRDWAAHPAIVEVAAFDHDLYALGDIHGDYDKAIKLLAAAKLITGIPASPKETTWAAGKSALVCTGDMIDKWNQSVEVLEMLRALQISAEKQGGSVIVALGNHEAEFLASQGDKKKAAEFTKELQDRGIAPADVAAGRDTLGIGQWLRTRPLAAKINDWFFCHAGNTFGATLPDLRQSLQAGIDKDGFGAVILAEPNSILEARMSPVPWWILNAPVPATRAADVPATAPTGSAILKDYLTALGCNHLVIGHQPGKISFGDGIERKAGQPFSYKGLLFLIDVGMSHGQANGQAALLKIHTGAKERADVIDESGKETPLWPSP